MTYPEFLEALRKTPRAWTFYDDDMIRAEGHWLSCPLTVVDGHPTDCSFMNAALRLEMNSKNRDEIVVAADNAFAPLKANPRYARYAQIRADLLEACGLTEAS